MSLFRDLLLGKDSHKSSCCVQFILNGKFYCNFSLFLRYDTLKSVHSSPIIDIWYQFNSVCQLNGVSVSFPGNWQLLFLKIKWVVIEDGLWIGQWLSECKLWDYECSKEGAFYQKCLYHDELCSLKQSNVYKDVISFSLYNFVYLSEYTFCLLMINMWHQSVFYYGVLGKG